MSVTHRVGPVCAQMMYAPLYAAVLLILFSTAVDANSDSVLVRIAAGDYANVSKIEALRTIDYGEFFWLELSDTGLAELEASGVSFERQRSPSDFSIQGLSVDTSAPPAALRSLSGSAGVEPEFYLVQLLGPAKDEWITQLANAGIHPMKYFSPYAHLVRITPGQADGLAELDFVRWVGPYLPAYRISTELRDMTGLIENVDVTMLADKVDETVATIRSLGGAEGERESFAGSDGLITVTFALPSAALDPVSQLNSVFVLSYRPTTDPLEDEMSDQIIAGNFGPITNGYQAWQAVNGISGNGITVALIDTGFDTGVDGTAHPDLSGRLVMVGTPTDTNGHGTHVGGIIAGNASLGTTDGSNFLLGLGVAPAADLVVRVNSGTDSNRQRDVVTRGAVASNNSYGINSAGAGYSARDSALDGLVRDADNGTAALEPLSIIFSAGNSGSSGPTKNAKNIIAVANSLNQRTTTGAVDTTQNINNLRGSSSRGPAADGRIYPHLTAPGTNIVSTRSTQAGITSCTTIASGANAPATDPTYSRCTGTSMAAPHVTGSVALITEWWNTFNAGNPSPAMVKALLVNGATDMGTADIPNNNEGWGRINLSNVINPGVATEYVDQTTVFSGTGSSWTDTFSPADPSQQVRVTVEWTDAPAAAGANPALVNDLDLVVADASNTFLGNVFSGGLSATGGAADTLNNLENVYIQSPADSFTVTVNAAAINGDGVPGNADSTDQDFALVCTNCIPNEPPNCDANGPYVAECALDTTLDGTGSSDPDGDPLSFTWSGPFTGSPTTGASPTVVFPAPLGIKSVDLEVSDGLASDFCSAQVSVQDTLLPTISCNNPPMITPPDAPISFTATATDQCAGSITPVITEYDCFMFTKQGKRIDKTASCIVSINGDTLTIADSGGVDDHIEWTVVADDGNGNVHTEICSLIVENPGQSL